MALTPQQTMSCVYMVAAGVLLAVYIVAWWYTNDKGASNWNVIHATVVMVCLCDVVGSSALLFMPTRTYGQCSSREWLHGILYHVGDPLTRNYFVLRLIQVSNRVSPNEGRWNKMLLFFSFAYHIIVFTWFMATMEPVFNVVTYKCTRFLSQAHYYVMFVSPQVLEFLTTWQFVRLLRSSNSARRASSSHNDPLRRLLIITCGFCIIYSVVNTLTALGALGLLPALGYTLTQWTAFAQFFNSLSCVLPLIMIRAVVIFKRRFTYFGASSSQNNTKTNVNSKIAVNSKKTSISALNSNNVALVH